MHGKDTIVVFSRMAKLEVGSPIVWWDMARIRELYLWFAMRYSKEFKKIRMKIICMKWSFPC